MNDEKQMIEEMAKFVCNACEMGGGFNGECAVGNDYKKCGISVETAEALYNAGYRKQSIGEWLTDRFGMERSICSVCGAVFEGDGCNYCRKCGAKMKGAENDS